MNIFKDRKTAKHFYEVAQALPTEKQDLFADRVKALFNRKNTSDEVFEEYKITAEEIRAIARECK